MSDLAGMTALVTGGGSGIGLGAAKRLAADGAHVTIAGRTEARLAEAVARDHFGRRARCHDAIRGVRRHRRSRCPAPQSPRAIAPAGGLDVLFACAGGSLHLRPDRRRRPRRAGRRRSISTSSARSCASSTPRPRWRPSGGGSIIAMSSIAGVSTHRLMSAYCVGKAGIEMLVKVAADELGEQGIRVNAVQPGLVDTELVAFITAGGKLLDDYLDQMPVARVGTVDDIASVVRFLAGPESTWITGQMIGIDGGHQLRRGPDYDLLFG